MAELELVPVKTRILTEKDNIVDAIEEYTQGQIGPDDLLCVAESVVAITQRRFTRPEELKPSWQARLMRRFVPGEGSMASLYGMQAAMELEGEWKMLVCFIIGFIAKLFGKDGGWYRLCRQASLTDDVTGTMPPFDKCIVYGPADPMGVAEKIKKRLGCYGACVADVNDLKRSAVLGYSRGIKPQEVAAILIDNPFGNASQKTPIVIIKNYGALLREKTARIEG
ncbi:MAG: coenzyme F420-0:L-glutamate ligase [Megasphaera micronuciformis]|nr:coenzyme F420-0:L-glutamate ligase [Megasphaera micronuciformis]